MVAGRDPAALHPVPFDKYIDCAEQKSLYLSGIERVTRYSAIQPQERSYKGRITSVPADT